MTTPDILVAVVDDDKSVRESLPDLLQELGFATAAFDSAETFLASDVARQAHCLILDIAMPGMTGPELHRELVNRGSRIPVIFITAHADSAVRDQLIRNGAVDCLFKPFTDEDLRDAIDRALAQH